MESSTSLDHYAVLCVIGKVRKKSNSVLYALKSIKKKYIQNKKHQDRILTEKQILCQTDHPFLVKLDSTFQDQKKLFFVLQYCPGGQLFNLLIKKKRFTQDQTRFYAAQIIKALEYLHSKGIIYRDLKPQNILINYDGYIKLTDFGLSKTGINVQIDKFQVCGTPQYFAPQMVKREGYGKAVDWWCLGSIIYELTHGLPPFYCKNNRSELFFRIRNQNPQISNTFSDKFKDLINMLLDKNPKSRLKNAQKIQQHPWFVGIVWEKLLSKSIKPPYVPVIYHDVDVSNFDKQFTQSSIESLQQSLEPRKYLEGFCYQRDYSQKNYINSQTHIKILIQ